MTDAELIKVVAKRLGWKYLKHEGLSEHDGFDVYRWYSPSGEMAELPPWLTSLDVCLDLLDDVGYTIHSWSEIPHLKQIKNYEVHYMGIEVRDESLPRAILLAFLEATHD